MQLDARERGREGHATQRWGGKARSALEETHMEPENHWVVEDKSLSQVYVQVPRGSLPGCKGSCSTTRAKALEKKLHGMQDVDLHGVLAHRNDVITPKIACSIFLMKQIKDRGTKWNRPGSRNKRVSLDRVLPAQQTEQVAFSET